MRHHLPRWFSIVLTLAALLSVFASQFKAPSIEPGVKRSAHSGSPTGPIERLWTLESLPDHLPNDELWVGAADIERASAALSRFRQGASVAGPPLANHPSANATASRAYGRKMPAQYVSQQYSYTAGYTRCR